MTTHNLRSPSSDTWIRDLIKVNISNDPNVKKKILKKPKKPTDEQPTRLRKMPCSAVECRVDGSSIVPIPRPDLSSTYRSTTSSSKYATTYQPRTTARASYGALSRSEEVRSVRDSSVPRRSRTASYSSYTSSYTSSYGSDRYTAGGDRSSYSSNTSGDRSSYSSTGAGDRTSYSAADRTTYSGDKTSERLPPRPSAATSALANFDIDELRNSYSPDNYIVGSSSGRSRLSKTEPVPVRSRTTALTLGSRRDERKDEHSTVTPPTTTVTSTGESEDAADGGEAAMVAIETAKRPITPPLQHHDESGRLVVGSAGPRSTTKPRPTSPSGTDGLSGLRNIGNTCFLNSVVQCLSNTRLLKDYLINREYVPEITNSESRGVLIKSFADVVFELWSGEGRIVNTSQFKSQIQKYAPRFMGYNQQDAQEFLRYLLQGIHDDVNRVTIKPRGLPPLSDSLPDDVKAEQAWQQYLRYDDSRIVDIFVGQLKSTLRCTVCQHASTTFEPFWDLSLPLPSRSGTLRLQQCLDHFTKEEVLDGDEMPTCSKCKTRRKCTKSFSINKFPKILVLHLKRFSPSERYRKLSATVEFPLSDLDMGAYGAAGGLYSLYAISNHSGTAYSGHYTAYCRHPHTGLWHEYNDARVTSISSCNIVSGEAYILFYEQQTSSALSQACHTTNTHSRL